MTMRQFSARMGRHVERFKDTERLERVRLGAAASQIMNAGMRHKKDGTAWMPWDVFPELQPMEEEADEEREANRILAMFKMMAAGQKAREEM